MSARSLLLHSISAVWTRFTSFSLIHRSCRLYSFVPSETIVVRGPAPIKGTELNDKITNITDGGISACYSPSDIPITPRSLSPLLHEKQARSRTLPVVVVVAVAVAAAASKFPITSHPILPFLIGSMYIYCPVSWVLIKLLNKSFSIYFNFVKF